MNWLADICSSECFQLPRSKWDSQSLSEYVVSGKEAAGKERKRASTLPSRRSDTTHLKAKYDLCLHERRPVANNQMKNKTLCTQWFRCM
ncbi:unnamed protein product [Arctia plantaginis]|uniref:Uncharacterized protein n=1 Tax=Arctia plantaginis TaxID=874455 RepID=A0A8S1AU97_ARCPL|nr:unnamed protein product [Arctia plantaginis]